MSPGQQQRNFISAETIRTDLNTFYQKPVTRVSLELVLSLTTVLFFALFALRPTLNTMSALVKEIDDKRVVDDALTKKIAALSTGQNEYLTYKPRFAVLDNAVHSDLTLDNALYYIEYMAGREGIGLTTLQIKDFPVASVGGGALNASASASVATPRRTIGIYSMQISFSGDYAHILHFFQSIETIRPLFSVQGFSFTTRKDQQKVSSLNGSATIYTYGYVPDTSSNAKSNLPKVPVPATGAAAEPAL